MFPSNPQFGARLINGQKFVLNKRVKKNYPQLLEQLTLQNKQQELIRKTCYPWQIECSNNSPPIISRQFPGV